MVAILWTSAIAGLDPKQSDATALLLPANGRGSPGERVLEHLAVFHHHDQVIRRVGDDVEIGERIAIHEQQIGQRLGVNGSNLVVDPNVDGVGPVPFRGPCDGAFDFSRSA
jgi:hypothetical protein